LSGLEVFNGKEGKMDAVKRLTLLVVLAVLVVNATGCCCMAMRKCPRAKKDVMRVGMVVGIREDVIPKYKELHADENPGVRDLLTKYNMHNFTIYLHEIDGKWYEFGYYEYTGDDYEGDMAKLDAEPRNKEWLKVCDPMQIPLPGEKGWAIMEEAYHND
jgi:L-rhamnose mutarotase